MFIYYTLYILYYILYIIHYTLYIYNVYIWVNYNNSPTWIKAIGWWFPLLTMIPVRSQWGRYNLPIYIYILDVQMSKHVETCRNTVETCRNCLQAKDSVQITTSQLWSKINPWLRQWTCQWGHVQPRRIHISFNWLYQSTSNVRI